MTDKELYENAVRLCEGGIAEINGLVVRTKVVEGDIHPCDICEMDSACRGEMMELCTECDKYDHKYHLLYLPNP